MGNGRIGLVAACDVCGDVIHDARGADGYYDPSHIGEKGGWANLSYIVCESSLCDRAFSELEEDLGFHFYSVSLQCALSQLLVNSSQSDGVTAHKALERTIAGSGECMGGEMIL